jgi:hypothetical protein
MSDPDLVEEIRQMRQRSPFHGEGHCMVWARLGVAGVRTSQRRVLRLMRGNALLAPSRVGSPREPRAHDGTIIPGAVDARCGTDLTTTITGQGQAAVFVAVDHHSAEPPARRRCRRTASRSATRTCRTKTCAPAPAPTRCRSTSR